MPDHQILVSVKMITYNHVHYIAQAIEGVLMQKTDFRFELVIGDDCSSDGTTQIIEDYVERYPNIIRAVIRKKNLGAKGNAKDLNNFLLGKYVALCEGDDYWTDPYKLQKQVKFFNYNPEYSLCFHSANVLREGKTQTNLFFNLEEREYSPNEIITKWVIPTATIMCRLEDYKKMIYREEYIFTDLVLFLTLAEYGKIWCINDCMSIYRRQPFGITQQKISLKKRVLHYETINKQFNYKYNKEIQQVLYMVYKSATKYEIKKFSIKFLLYLTYSVYFKFIKNR